MLSAITVTWSFLFHILIRDLRRHREWNLLHSHGKMETTFWHSILGRKLLCQKQFLMQYFAPSICSMIAKTFFLLFCSGLLRKHSTVYTDTWTYLPRSLKNGFCLHNERSDHVPFPCQHSVYLRIGEQSPLTFPS